MDYPYFPLSWSINFIGAQVFYLAVGALPPAPGSLFTGASLVYFLLELQIESLHKPYITQSPRVGSILFFNFFFFN